MTINITAYGYYKYEKLRLKCQRIVRNNKLKLKTKNVHFVQCYEK